MIILSVLKKEPRWRDDVDGSFSRVISNKHAMIKQQLRLFHKQSLEGEEDEHHPSRDGNHAWRHLGSEPRPRQHSEKRRNEVPKTSPHKNGENWMCSSEENRGNLGAIAPLREENHQEDLQH